jgi:hypothetical protein
MHLVLSYGQIESFYLAIYFLTGNFASLDILNCCPIGVLMNLYYS